MECPQSSARLAISGGSRCGRLAEVVGLGDTSLAEALTRMLKNPQRAEVMGKAGAELIRGDYTWPAIAGHVIETYRGAR